MSTLTQPLDAFINEQISSGLAKSKTEAEQLILSALKERELDRKLAKAEKQIEQGQYQPLDHEFISDFLVRARKRNHCYAANTISNTASLACAKV